MRLRVDTVHCAAARNMPSAQMVRPPLVLTAKLAKGVPAVPIAPPKVTVLPLPDVVSVKLALLPPCVIVLPNAMLDVAAEVLNVKEPPLTMTLPV